MTWDAKTNGLPADFNDRYPIPKEKDEVTLRGGPFQIPSGGVVDLTESIIAASSSTMPETVKVNNVTFTQVADMSLINASGQYWVDRGNSRLHFHTSDVGAMVTQARGWCWGTHVRKKHWLDAYSALKDVANVLKPLGDALQANAKLQVMLEVQAVNDLLSFNPATFNGTKAYVRGTAKWYYSNGISWVPETSGGDQALAGAQIATISPANFALNTPLESDIVLTFDMSMQAVAIEIRDKGGNLKAVAAGQVSNYGKTWTFDPVANLAHSESPYTVIIRIMSVDVLGRNLATDRYYYFATQADPAPVADQISAIDGSVTNAGLAIKFEALGADFPPTNPVYRDLYVRLNDTGAWSLFAANIALVWDSGLNKYKYIIESGLQKGTLYGIKARIRDASTQWADSNSIAITTAEDMSPPALLSSQIAVSNISANGCLVTTSGTQPTDPDDPDAAITFLLRVAGNSTPYGEYTWAALQTGVLVNHAFGYGEKAISLQVKSTLGQKVSFSAETAKTFSVPVPVPTGLAAVGSDQKVTLNWTGIGVSGATYNLYFSTSPGVTKSNGTKIMGVTSPYEHTGRVNDTAYYYVVTAVVDGVESADSSQASAIPSANQTPSATITASDITATQMRAAGLVSGLGTGDSVNTIRVAYRLGSETADQAVTAGRFFDITGAGITAYQGAGHTQTGLALNGQYTVAVRVLENMAGGGTQWGVWANGTSFVMESFDQANSALDTNKWYVNKVANCTAESNADIFNSQQRHIVGWNGAAPQAASVQATYKTPFDFTSVKDISWKMSTVPTPVSAASSVFVLVPAVPTGTDSTNAQNDLLQIHALVENVSGTPTIRVYANKKVNGTLTQNIFPVVSLPDTPAGIDAGVILDLRLRLTANTLILFRNAGAGYTQIAEVSSGLGLLFTQGYPCLKPSSGAGAVADTNYTINYDDLFFINP